LNHDERIVAVLCVEDMTLQNHTVSTAKLKKCKLDLPIEGRLVRRVVEDLQEL
jgi:hypothetical protein